LSGAEIEYVEQATRLRLRQRVPSPSAILQVRFENAQAHDAKGKVTAKSACSGRRSFRRRRSAISMAS
jgi:hypothetical protein